MKILPLPLAQRKHLTLGHCLPTHRASVGPTGVILGQRSIVYNVGLSLMSDANLRNCSGSLLV